MSLLLSRSLRSQLPSLLFLAAASLLGACGGCSKSESENSASGSTSKSDAAQLSFIRSALAERDSKLHSYRFEAKTVEGENVAAYRFAFRSPNRMRGDLTAPLERTLTFDGQTLRELLPGQKSHTTFDNTLAPEKSALFLATTFRPFVPEGFRAPLIPFENAKIQHVSHAKAPGAWALTVQAEDAGEKTTVTYLLREPSMDFLEKRTVLGSSVQVVRMEEEHCELKLGICVPTKLVQELGGSAPATTTLSNVELGATLPTELFAPPPPTGFSALRRQLVDAP